MSRHKARKNLRSIFQWHRYVGLTAVLFVIVLAVTGIMLDHTEALSLDHTYIKSDFLLDWYGITPPHIDTAFLTANHAIIQIEDRVYLDRRALTASASSLRGAVEANGLIAVAVDDAILLFTPRGELVEKLRDAEGVPAGLRRIGRTQDGNVIVDTAQGLYTTDKNFLTWHRYRNAASVVWSRPHPAPPALVQDLAQRYRSHILSIERVILDLHSGRILGSWGVFVVDAAALLFCFLGISGGWLWFGRSRKRKAHVRKKVATRS